MIWSAVLPGLVLLGLVIFVHELGHFLAAKWRGVKVLRFALGFGPALFAFKRGETEYRLSWIPLGGYVQMAGDTPSDDGDMGGGPDEFLSHPWFGRLLIAAAGPAMNLVTAFLVLWIMFGVVGVSIPDTPSLVGATPDSSIAAGFGLREGDRIVSIGSTEVQSWRGIEVALGAQTRGEAVPLTIERAGRRLDFQVPTALRDTLFRDINLPSRPPIVGSVVTGMPADKAGIKEGDRVVAVEGKPIHTWEELPQALAGRVDQTTDLTIERDGRTLEVTVSPINADATAGGSSARIGIEAPRDLTYTHRFRPGEALGLAWRSTGGLIANVYSGMWLTVTRPLYYREYLGGPMFIAQAASENARRGFDSYLQFLALINLAIMAFNLLPLPVLDGGHILLALIQAVRRQAISARAYLRFQKVGLVLIGTLFVIILANDPLRVLQRHRAIENAGQERTVDPTP